LTKTNAPQDPTAEIRDAAQLLSQTRGRPCLLAMVPHFSRACLATFCDVIASLPTGVPVDVVLSSHGGCIDTAYVIARALGRRRAHTAVFVPLCAKSAATLVALVANELVVGPLGELGPIDAQFDRKQQADFSARCSELAVMKAVGQAGEASLDLFDEAVRRIVGASGMTAADGAARAADLVGELMGRVYGQLDPVRVAEAGRALEVAIELASRVLRRYRSEVGAEQARTLLQRLTYGYPCHGFPLDFEELIDLELPVRAPEGSEADCLHRMARVLLPLEDQIELLEVVQNENGAAGADAPYSGETKCEEKVDALAS